MSVVAQSLHILRKDIRALAPEFGGVIVLNLLLVIGGTSTWPGIVERIGNRSGSPIAEALPFVAGALVLVWWILVARLVQAESPASRSQPWLTRPYSRNALLLAKCAAVLLCVHLPLLLAQLSILGLSGVPFAVADLALNQLVIAVMISLPAAALASLSPSLRRFVFGSVLLVIVAIAFGRFSGIGRAESFYNVGGIIDEAPYALGNWLRLSVLLAAIALIAGAVLIWQYRSRATGRVAAAGLVALLAVGIFVLAFPRSLVSASNARIIGAPESVPALRFRSPPADARLGRMRQPAANYYRLPAFLGGGAPRWEGVVEVPIDVSAAGARRVELANSRVEIETDAGVEAAVWAGVSRHADGRWLRFRVPVELYRRIADSGIRLRVAADVLVYSAARSESIPPDGSQVVVAAEQRCGIAWGARLVCRGAFRNPPDRVFDATALADGELSIWQRDVVSIPFALSPVVVFERSVVLESWMIPNVPPDRRLNGPLTVRTVRPTGYARVELEIEGLRLADWGL